jgi:stearoyl-CoA desaturase (delta-9 desaturase)
MHHAHTDTEEDPHSLSHDANILVMMWKTKNIYQDINDQRILVAPQFLNGVPKWKNFDLFAGSKISRILWIAAYPVFFCFFPATVGNGCYFPLLF